MSSIIAAVNVSAMALCIPQLQAFTGCYSYYVINATRRTKPHRNSAGTPLARVEKHNTVLTTASARATKSVTLGKVPKNGARR